MQCVMCKRPMVLHGKDMDDDRRFILTGLSWIDTSVDEEGYTYDSIHVEDVDTCGDISFICPACEARLPGILDEIERLHERVKELESWYADAARDALKERFSVNVRDFNK